MKSNEIIERFKEIGFKEYEAKIFLVLLKGLPLSASEIAKEAGLIRTSIYDSLKTFVEKGYCNEIETASILKYRIIDPQVIVDKVEKEFNELNTKKISSLKNTFQDAAELTGYGKNEDQVKEDNIELIRGFNKHRVVKYTGLVNNAKKEILGMNRLRGIVTEELQSPASELIKNGGSVKYIYKISLDFKIKKDGKLLPAKKEDLVRICREFESLGEEVRLTDMNIPNAAIFDGETVYINVTSNNPNAKNKQSDIIIKRSDFVENMREMFIYYWNNSISIDEYESQNRKEDQP